MAVIKKVNVDGTEYDIQDVISNYITGSEVPTNETDPTVPSWAKASTKPSYTASEVGALPDTTVIPSATSDLTNDSGFIIASDVPSAGTTATAVSTTAFGGSATTWSKSDHVHSLSSSTITSALGYTPYNSTNPDGYTTNTGTVTSVAISGTSPISASGTITTSGTLTVTHENSGVTAKTTQALYPFKVNATGHITEVGSAVTVPSASSTTPLMDGTASAGSETTYARGDHVHPSYRYIAEVGSNISGDYYSLIGTYAGADSAINNGYYVAILAGQTEYPFVAKIEMSGVLMIVCGFSATMQGTTQTYGYAILPNDTVLRLLEINTFQQQAIVTTIDSTSTDAQYPSAKCVYDLIGDIETLLASI